ncbi:MAG: Flp pilus assembly complex ATPase component TadA [Myxococcales bacterium]|nr:Flp pilus assembly complex ATPase component TadA [Myxococcales bacterium]
MFKLVVSEKGGPTKEIEFDKDEVTIGRVPGNDIVLPGNNVSKRHSRVVRQDGRFFVVDLKSTNGTYLNGRRIMTPSPLRAGDKIFVGSFVLVLEGAEAGIGDDADAGDIPAEGASLVEPIPLDQEPLESQPPPAPEPVGRPTFANPLNAGPRAAMQTQPLSTGPAIAATMAMQQREQQNPSPPSGVPRVGASPAASSSRPVAPTSAQPGPGTPSSPGVAPTGPARPGSIPTMNAGSPPPGARPSVPGIAARSPASGAGPARPPSGNWPPAKPAAAPVPATAPTMPEPVDEPAAEQPSTPPPSAAPIAPPAVSQTAPPPPPTPAPAPAPVEPPVARPHPSAPTITVGSKVVDQVIQAHRASVEPTPPGNEYAALLASVIADALEAGVSANPNQLGDAGARSRARGVVENLARGRDSLPTGVTSERVTRDAVAELVGAGPIELALEEPDVTSVLVAPSGRVLVGRGGGEGASPFWFSSSAAVSTAVDRLLHASGVQRVGEQPFIECVLPDAIGHGTARMTVVYAPGAAAPSISIERAARRASAFAELVAAGVLSAAAQRTITMALDARRNVFIVGPRGSARSTLLGTFVAHLATNERVVALEARPELSTIHREVSVVPITKDPKRSLEFAHALRPHRLVFAQVDDSIAAALVGTMVTGSEGSIAVLDGASGSTALAHLAAATGAKDEGLARVQATRPFIVQLARLGDGSARVASLGEARVDGGHVVIDELFVLRVARSTDRGTLSAELVATGTNPSFGG